MRKFIVLALLLVTIRGYTYDQYLDCRADCQNSHSPSSCFADGECNDLLVDAFTCAGSNSDCVDFSTTFASADGEDDISTQAAHSEYKCISNCYSCCYTGSQLFDTMNKCNLDCILNAYREEEFEEGDNYDDTCTYEGQTHCDSLCQDRYFSSDCIYDGECSKQLTETLECYSSNINCLDWQLHKSISSGDDYISIEAAEAVQQCQDACVPSNSDSYIVNQAADCQRECLVGISTCEKEEENEEESEEEGASEEEEGASEEEQGSSEEESEEEGSSEEEEGGWDEEEEGGQDEEEEGGWDEEEEGGWDEEEEGEWEEEEGGWDEEEEGGSSSICTYEEFIDCTAVCQEEFSVSQCLGDGECSELMYELFGCISLNSDCLEYKYFVADAMSDDQISYEAIYSLQSCHDNCYITDSINWYFNEGNRCQNECVNIIYCEDEEEEWEEEEEGGWEEEEEGEWEEEEEGEWEEEEEGGSGETPDYLDALIDAFKAIVQYIYDLIADAIE